MYFQVREAGGAGSEYFKSMLFLSLSLYFFNAQCLKLGHMVDI